MKKASKSETKNSMPPALNNEARENRMISLAMDVAEQQLQNGTASAQVITHYLKLATEKAKLEKERMLLENELTRAKTEAIKSEKRIEELYTNALKAMRSYRGEPEEDDEFYE